MIRSHLRKTLAGLLVLTLLAVANPARAAGVPAAKRLPPEVVIFVTAPDISDLKKRFDLSQLGRMIKDPALKAFVDDVNKGIDAAGVDLQKELGISLKDLLKIPSGNVALAFFVGDQRPLGWTVLLDFGESRQAVDQLLKKASDALIMNGAKKTQVAAGGTSISNFQLPVGPLQPGDGPPASLTKLGWFIKDTTLVLGNGAESLRNVLVRWDGKHDSTFAGNPVYRYIAEKGGNDGAEPVLKWYFDPIAAVTGIVSAADPNNFQAQLFLGFLPTLGLDKFKAIGGTINIVTPKYDSITRTVIYVDAPRKGALDLLKFPAIAQSPPKWVPVNATAYASFNWDLQAAWRGVASLVDQFNPQGPGTFDRLADDLAQQPGGPMIHPKKDLLDHLSGRIQIVTDAPDGPQGGQPTSRFLVALGVRNVAGLKATLNKLVNSPGSPVMARQFRGETIYDLPLPVQLGAAGLGTIGISITQNQLMIGVPGTLIEQAIRGDVKPLSSSPEYQRLAANFPAKTSSISFQKQDSQLKAIYDLLKSGTFPPTPPGAGFPGGDANSFPIDFSKLPPFEVIQKYLSPAGSYIVPDENGAVIVSFSLRKKTSP